METKTGIYKITNLIDGSVYIGKSINIYSRFLNHKNPTIQNKRSNTKLYNAINKYGIQNFSFEIIEECKAEQLNDREKYGIKYYHSYFNDPLYKKGYNMTEGGDGRTSEEAKQGGAERPEEKIKGGQKMQKIKKEMNYKHSEETKRKIGEAQRNYRKLHPYTEEEKYHLAATMGTHLKVYDLNHNFIRELPSYNYALKKFLGLKSGGTNSIKALNKSIINNKPYHNYYGEIVGEKND